MLHYPRLLKKFTFQWFISKGDTEFLQTYRAFQMQKCRLNDINGSEGKQ